MATREQLLAELARRELEKRQQDKGFKGFGGGKSEGKGATDSFAEDPFLPGQTKVDEKISKRSDLLSEFVNYFKEPPPEKLLDRFLYTINPLQGMKDAGGAALKGVGGVIQRGEAGIANAGLEAQRGETSLLDEFSKGVKGQKLGEFGDLVRTTGYGGIANEALATTIGFASMIGATNLATKGKLAEGASKAKKALEARSAAKEANKKFFFKQKAEMLYEGADDVVNSVRQEFDDLYKKIGNNTIGPADKALVQEAVNNLGSAQLKRFAKTEGIDLLKGELPADLNTVKSIKGVIGRSIPSKVWSGIDDATPDQIKLMNVYHDLSDVLANNAGKEKDILLSLNKKYKEVLDYRKIITGVTKTKTTGVTKTSIKDIKNVEMQGTLYELENFSKKFFPKAGEIIKEIDKYNKTQKFIKGVSTAAKVGVGYELGRRFLVNPLLNGVKSR